MLELFHTNLWTMVMVVTLIGCLIPLVAIMTEHERKVRRAELDNELKRDLLAQGKDPDEIQAVLEANSERAPWWAKQAN